jgi:hypothetical protein
VAGDRRTNFKTRHPRDHLPQQQVVAPAAFRLS